MAGLIVFVCLLFFMFQAGYQWHKWESRRPPSGRDVGRGIPSEKLMDSMIGKL